MHKVNRAVLLSVIAVTTVTLLLFLGAVIYVLTKNDVVTIRFETFGGTPIEPISSKAGGNISFPADPEKAGYIFGGWYLSEDFSGNTAPLPAAMPETDVTYYAKFNKLVTLRYTGTAPEKTDAEETLLQSGTVITLRSPTVPQGFYFLGWTAESDETIYAAGETMTVNCDACFSGCWAKLYPDGRGTDHLLAVGLTQRAGIREAVLLSDGMIKGSCTDNTVTLENGLTGKLDGYGNFLLSDSGDYAEYSLRENPPHENGTLTLDFDAGTAVYHADGTDFTGTYAYLYDETQNAYTGRYRYDGEISFLFLLDENGFLREGEEKGSYLLYADCAVGDTALSLDGFGNAVYTENGKAKEAPYRGVGESEWELDFSDGTLFVTLEWYRSFLGDVVLEEIPVFLLRTEE